ncbi:MAG: aldehyde dehydrogenase [Actinomycetota bacterium]|nr:aldehyde dehydrogenase [Actinomycetota bacterium]
MSTAERTSPRVDVVGVDVSPDHYIGGERVASPETFLDLSPLDEEPIVEVARGGAADVEAAVSAAREAFPGWAARGPEGRAAYLLRVAEVIESRVDELAAVETIDNGSLLEASRLRLMKRAARNFRFFAELAVERSRRSWESDGTRYHVRHDPSGVAALITPWNAPFMLETWKCGPALAAGCTAVLKPAEWAPLTASLLADIARDAGLPPGVLNVVQGIGEEAGAALVAHPGIARISFTGSVETAQAIGAAAARNLTPVSFELGGKSPFLVFADADLDRAVETATYQYDNAGQVCLAGTRLLVEEMVYEEFLAAFLERVARLKLGDPREPDTDVGPLITREHLVRVEGFVARALADEASLVLGGRVSPELGGLYYEPTLLEDVDQEMEVVQKEVFGPVLTLQSFRDEAEAVELANGTEYGLAATVFTRDEARVERLGEALVAGTTWINCFYARDLAAPFGGAKRSGIGREGGEWSFDFYADVKTVARRL